jgi:uncharacterized membrane protein
MSKTEKIKRTVLIAIGFAMATYLIMSAMAILDKESAREADTSGKVHSNTVE